MKGLCWKIIVFGVFGAGLVAGCGKPLPEDLPVAEAGQGESPSGQERVSGSQPAPERGDGLDFVVRREAEDESREPDWESPPVAYRKSEVRDGWVFSDVIQVEWRRGKGQPSQTDLGRFHELKPLYLGLELGAKAPSVQRLSYSYRRFDSQNRMLDRVQAQPGLRSVDHDRWYVPLTGLLRGLPASEFDRQHELILEIEREGLPREVRRVFFRMAHPQLRSVGLLQVGGVQKPQAEGEFLKREWVLRQEQAVNLRPVPVVLRVEAESLLQLEQQVTRPVFAFGYEGYSGKPVSRVASRQSRRATGALPRVELEVARADGSVRRFSLESDEAVSISLDREEQVGLTWIARTSKDVASGCDLRAVERKVRWRPCYPKAWDERHVPGCQRRDDSREFKRFSEVYEPESVQLSGGWSRRVWVERSGSAAPDAGLQLADASEWAETLSLAVDRTLSFAAPVRAEPAASCEGLF